MMTSSHCSAVSPVLGGVIAQHLGFPPAFATLGALSVGSLMIWLGSASRLRRFGDGAARETGISLLQEPGPRGCG